jgi:hypothetical protein
MDIIGSTESFYAKFQSPLGERSVYIKYVTLFRPYFSI